MKITMRLIAALITLIVAVLLINLKIIEHRAAKTDHCNWNPRKQYPEFGFFESGTLLTDNPTKWSAALILDPKDWDHNLWFTGRGWEKDRSKCFYGKDSCEVKNKICWAFGWDNYYKH